MRDTIEKFTWPTVGLHWIIAIAVIGMLTFGLYLEDMPRSPEKGQLMGVHKSIGVIILAFAVVRIFWRYLNKFPKPISALPNWQKTLASISHWVLIIGTVMMPFSGILMSIGGGNAIGVFGFELIAGSGEKNESLSEIGKTIHGLGSKILIAFVLLHSAGAIKHQVLDKDGTISRMLGKEVRKK